MKGFRPLTMTAALAVASGGALAPVLASATPAAAQPSCAGTGLVTAIPLNPNIPGPVFVRVPTLRNGSINQNCILGVGNAGVAVSRLQIALDQCNGFALSVDGIYGPQTRSAVSTVQRRNHISVDGIYGPNTLSVMHWPQAGSGGRVCAISPA